MGKIESRGVYPAVLTVDAMKDGEYMRHGGGSYEAGGDSGVALLLCNLFLHQPDVSFLLFDGTALGSQRGLEDVM